jgi:hypothetical protein
MAFGVLILSTEAVGVSRALAAQHHCEVDTSRDLPETALAAIVIVASRVSSTCPSCGAWRACGGARSSWRAWRARPWSASACSKA